MPWTDDSTDLEFDPDDVAAAGSGIFGLPCDPQQARVHVLPVPFDATTSYRAGAAHGPAAVFEASKQVELFDLDFKSPWRAGIYMHPVPEALVSLNQAAARSVAIARDDPNEAARSAALEQVNSIGNEVNRIVSEQVVACFESSKLPVILGGDHSVPFGAIEVAAQRYPGLGVLHFDAHADLRVAFEGCTWSHASILHNVLDRIDSVACVVQCGIRDLAAKEHESIRASDRVHTLFDRDWRNARAMGKSPFELIDRTLSELPESVWVTFDVDGLDPTLCPNTGTPVPGGFDWGETMLWLEALARSGRRVVGVDLCEVSPGPQGDPRGESWDAIVGARLLYKLIGAALASHPEL